MLDKERFSIIVEFDRLTAADLKRDLSHQPGRIIGDDVATGPQPHDSVGTICCDRLHRWMKRNIESTIVVRDPRPLQSARFDVPNSELSVEGNARQLPAVRDDQKRDGG